jgi:hypothetical protein
MFAPPASDDEDFHQSASHDGDLEILKVARRHGSQYLQRLKMIVQQGRREAGP